MGVPNYSEMAEVAANWWAEQIKIPETYDIKDYYSKADMIKSKLYDSRTKASKEQAKEFKIKLKEAIEIKIKEAIEKEQYGFSICVDYAPEPILGNIANDLGINFLAFQFKAHMFICIKYESIDIYHEAKFLYTTKEGLEKRIKDAKEHLKNLREKEDEEFTIFSKEEIIEERISYIEKLEKLLKEKLLDELL